MLLKWSRKQEIETYSQFALNEEIFLWASCLYSKCCNSHRLSPKLFMAEVRLVFSPAFPCSISSPQLLYLQCHWSDWRVITNSPPSQSPYRNKLRVFLFTSHKSVTQLPMAGAAQYEDTQVEESSVGSLNSGTVLFQVLEVSSGILHPQVALSQRFPFKFYVSMDELHFNHLCGSWSSWHSSYSQSFDISSSG